MTPTVVWSGICHFGPENYKMCGLLMENSKLSVCLSYFLYVVPKLPPKLLLYSKTQLICSLVGTQAEMLRDSGVMPSIGKLNIGKRAASHTLHSSSQFHPETCCVWVTGVIPILCCPKMESIYLFRSRIKLQ